jgi:catechol 2,3-dioxygenase-like lactoylglutathione lyase family enzyme
MRPKAQQGYGSLYDVKTMLHHISFGVIDLQRSIAFYDAVLGTLGYVRVWSEPAAAGYGLPGGEDVFALKLRGKPLSVPGDGFHLAFAAPDREAVAGFHAVALQQGGVDNGAAGLRPDYGASYFAAFVVDPDGYRIEAVFTGPEPARRMENEP